MLRLHDDVICDIIKYEEEYNSIDTNCAEPQHFIYCFKS